MKKVFIVLIGFSTLLMAACGGGKSTTNETDSTTTTTTTETTQPAATPASNLSNPSDPGAQLISKSDCLGCHKEHEKLVGPSYADVAQKYTDKDIDMLAEHIIKGGAGHWGDVAMTPHPQLSTDSAKLMVKYILTVK